MKLTLSGITINVDPADAQRYLRAGYVRAIELPAERPAKVEAAVTKMAKARKEKKDGND
jgi:predicted site-specific integrase-resolvase